MTLQMGGGINKNNYICYLGLKIAFNTTSEKRDVDLDYFRH